MDEWIERVVDIHLGPAHSRAVMEKLFESPELARFLNDDAGIASLYISKQKNNEIKAFLDLNIEQSDLASNTIVLTKLHPGAAISDPSELSVTSVCGASPEGALSQVLHDVFVPMLRNSKCKMKDKARTLLSDLDACLISELGRTAQMDVDTQSINSLTDEFKYWEKRAENSQGRERERCVFFKEAIQGLVMELDYASSLGMTEIAEISEKVQDSLDDIWRQKLYAAYLQPRMDRIMCLICDKVISLMKVKLKPSFEQKNAFSKLKDELRAAIQVCDRISQVLTSLTVRFWPNFGPHAWIGTKFESENLTMFLSRLHEYFELRSSHNLIHQLLSHEERKEVQFEKAMTWLKDVDPFSPDSSRWDTATLQYKKSLSPAEQLIAVKLSNLFTSIQSQPHQMLQEFQKYGNLIKSDVIFKKLASEREALLGQIMGSLKQISVEFKYRMNDSKKTSDESSQYLQTIVWLRQALSKIDEASQAVEVLSPNNTGFEEMAAELFKVLKRSEKEQFSAWVSHVEDVLENDVFRERLQSGKLMEMNQKDGSLRVNFDESLVTLIREVRQLMGFGHMIPQKILKAIESLRKFYRYGVILKQVAHFYNTIHEQMLPSQFTMLLEPAKNFERLVRDPLVVPDQNNKPGGGFDWSAQATVEEYITRLQASANHLTSENRRLRKYHSLICDIVVNLLSVDLVKPQTKGKWKESISSIRGLISSAQEGGIKAEDTLNWRNHWDYQLYKALEYQYRLSLENLNENLPEVKIDLIFQQQKLQFRPAFENIKANYFREMKNIINIPSAFKGLGDTSIFSRMVDTNSASLAIVYRKSDELFSSLLAVFDGFKEWIVLGTIPLEEFVLENLVDASDWEINFRMVKSKGKEAEQIPPSIQIDCFTISTAPLKATIDDHLQRLFDCLLTCLRKSVEDHLAIIDEFVSQGTDVLGKRPQTMEEIGEANSNHEKLSAAKNSIAHHFEKAEIKNRLLKSVCGGGIDISKVHTKWSRLELMLESHELVIKEQVEMLRNAIEGRRQAFTSSMDKFASRWKQLKPKMEHIHETNYAAKAMACIKERTTEFDELVATKAQIELDCKHFGMQVPDLADLDGVSQNIVEEEAKWGFFAEYDEAISSVLKEDWISFRGKSNKFEDLLIDWLDRVRAREVDTLSAHIQSQIDSYREVFPFFKFLRGDSWMTEHWGDLFRIISIPKGVSLSELTVGHIIKAKAQILSKIAEIKDLNGRANGEVAIREALQELEMWGAGAVFALSDFQDAKGNNLKIIKDWKETMAQVGDNQSLLQSLKDSPYYKNFADKTQIWEQKLSAIDEILRNLNSVQRKWVYLEPIFNHGALPSEQSRFSRIDSDFCRICAAIAKDNRIVSVLSISNARDTLNALVDQLERCQKALNEFLESKRARFPRFYFIGDEDLLEILGQAQNPNVIQSHLKKLFAGVNQVEFNEDTTAIIAMKSIEGETVRLKTPVPLSHSVESWLDTFTKEMQSTLMHLLGLCLEKSDIFKYPSQVLDLAESINFTSKCTEAIKKGTLSQLSRDLKANLEKYTSFNAMTIDDASERKVMDIKVKSMILDVIHFIDVVEQLQKAGIASISDWEWQRQLRFYINKEAGNTCSIIMNEAVFNYTFEYQGNPPKLVHTPLTDKCYLTLTQAMASGFGGNPFGPAGTGKTESVKALGVLFGRQVLVFNCDEGIDYKSMGRIFVGLVKCGGWGCFDEFNRLDEAVLSAVSQQIQVIQAALKKKEKFVTLLNQGIDLNPNSGIFVTLNPAGKGYGGRQKLPDNLKQLFRSVAMTHPNNDLIAEVILFSEGFKLGKELGTKVVSVFSLCKQLLSIQQHYEWGLRPLKTVLGLAGRLLHEEKQKNAIDRNREIAIAVKALRVNTLSKLTLADAQRFNALVKDVFPEAKIEDIAYDTLSVAVKEVFEDMNLDFTDAQCDKIYQLHEACRQRMGVVIVGPSGSGKSVLWQVLEKAWRKCGFKLKKHIVNPKAIDRHSLLGRMDIDTREWFDGILTFASRQAVRESLDTHTWILCDGDIDPEWIESLNSVLDDNRLLTMPNGERIQFGPNVNFIFETHNLKFASPATVSRMGMIYLSDDTLDAKSIVKSWISRLPEDIQKNMSAWIDAYFFRALEWVSANGEAVVETSKTGVIGNGLSHISDADSKISFIYGLIRGFGSNLQVESRILLGKELLQWSNETCPDPKRLLDFYIDNGRPALYSLREPEELDFKSVKDIDDLPVVENIDVQRAMDTIMPWLANAEPFILVGPEGAGKHMILRHCFKIVRAAVATVHCSAQTRSFHLIQRLSQFCISVSTNTGRVLKPKDSDRLVLYLKDINLPKPDKYETVEFIQLMQQLITYKGFYDANLEWVGIENVQVVASMTPSTRLGRSPLSTRFTSIVHQYYISYTNREELISTYRILAGPIISSCAPSSSTWNSSKSIHRLAASMISIYDQICQKFTTDICPHYIFTPRDLSRWIFGFNRYEIQGEDEHNLIEVLAYEAMSLFHDRLVGAESRAKLVQIISSVLKTDWGWHFGGDKFVFSSACKGNAATKKLLKLDLKTYSDLLSKEIYVYERDYKDLNLALFPEALESISKVERILSQPGGSLLLVGRPGVNRHSNVLIVAHMLRIRVFTPNVVRKYTPKAFAIQIKEVMQAAGVQNEESLLLLEDYQLIEPTFLEYVNGLLSGCEIPGLYSQDEMDALTSNLKSSHSEDGFNGSLFEYFVHRVRRNLHIVLIMDSAHPQFVTNCESNPALYTRCQIQWMDAWTSDSTKIVCENVFKASAPLQKLSDKDKLIQIILSIHKSRVAFGATPKNLVEYLTTYEKVYSLKLQGFESKLKYLGGGLQKLHEASKFVDNLSADAKKQEIELAKKQKEADLALKEITDSILRASDQKTEMETLSLQLKEEEVKMLRRKEGIERELSDVEPIVKQAQAAVGEIKNESLTEIRSLRAPPPAVRDVLEGVLRLMGNLDMSWNSMKGFLGKRTVKDEIMNFNARTITPAVRESVTALLKSKGESFEEAVIRRSSVAAAPLAMWVKANLQYSSVLERIGPLEADLAKLSQSLDASKDRVVKLKGSLDEVDKNVAALRENFGEKTRDAETLRNNLEKAAGTIKSSQELLGKLSGEGKRWSQQGKEIKAQMESLPRNSLIAAGFIVYLSGSSEDIRQKFLNEWKNVSGVSEFDFRKVMCSESDQLSWKAEGLPGDALSMENAISVLYNGSTSFLVDPAMQATSWLKTHLADKKPEVIKQHDDNFMRAFELALRFGKTLIIEEVNEIEPILFPILRKDLLKQGPRYMVQLGDKTVDYSENFKLFLVTSKAQFVVPTFASGLINEINFTITRAGLASQLLGLTLKHEKPELEGQKLQLLKSEEDLKLQLSSLEESVLKELASSDGNILENKSLITSLNETNSKSKSISSSLQNSLQLQKALDEERDKFTPLSEFGSSLYFVISELSNANSMYQFSLASYVRIFENALKFEGSAAKDGTELRLKLLMNELQKIAYKHVSRSIFKADRQMFALYMIYKLHPNLFEAKEWAYFIGQLMNADVDDGKGVEYPRWIPSDRKLAFRQFKSLLPEVYDNCNFGDNDSWTNWIGSSSCETEFPQTLSKRVSSFQKVLLVKALRPDRLMSAMSSFCCHVLGVQSLAPAALNFKRIFDQETIAAEPILFITTPGADPSQELREFAVLEVGLENYRQVSMGQGQGALAITELREMATKGGWVCLQNVHLVIRWLPELEKEIGSLNFHPKFRLWLTSEAHAKFPVSLLQSSLKITSEAPPGVKKNLQRIYEGWTPDFIRNGPVVRAQALFALAWYHAIIQERRNYIPQGWNKFYEFSAADLRSSADVLSSMCADAGAKNIQWPILHGLLENAIYGGRIDDVYDDLKLKAYLDLFFNDDVFTIGGKAPTKKLTKGVALPTLADHAEYVKLINDLPEVDPMSMFGLPSNIDRALQGLHSATVISQIKSLRNLDIQGEKIDRERWSKELMPFLLLWKKLNTGTDLIQRRVKSDSNADPVSSFLALELGNGVSIMQRIHSDLSLMSKTLRGTILMTNDVLSVCMSLMKAETPSSWLNLWEGPEDAQEFLTSAVRNTLNADSLCGKAQNGAIFSSPLSMASLFNPIPFLNALRQQTSRKLKKPMDDFVLFSTWKKAELAQAALPIAVEGLLLQGCTMDGSRLIEATAEDASFAAVPTVYIAWMPKNFVLPSRMDIPLYVTPSREKIVGTLQVPCNEEEETRWTLAGVAFFLTD
ncbi:dynein heavy chain and region D6 of dynein motor-domain-containing protein [Chytriomyces cf. hyalinus JEL632]|nr:dynein heavy chain and region D6 of dynein motor-domain-containing protein [Chytriomyces cf. hyalinus JEL632]